MTSADATNLLLAVAGSLNVKDSVESAVEYGALKTNGKWSLNFLPLSHLQSLPARHSFFDALVALIDSGKDGNLQAAFEGVEASEDIDLADWIGPPLRITASLLGPVRRARLTFEVFYTDSNGDVHSERKESLDYYMRDRLPGNDLAGICHARSDLSYDFSFTHQTIVRVANLLRN